MLTGKGLDWGGSLIRPEATGYGAVYFAQEMLATRGDSVEGKIGAGLRLGQRGPVHRREAATSCGAKVVTLSDSDGTIVDEDGINAEKLAWVMDLKNVRRGRISEYAEQFKGAKYLPDKRPWGVKCDLAFPSATQNEIDGDDAKTLVDNGCICVAEGANMPTDARRRRRLPGSQDPLRAGQGGQRRRRGRLGPGDDPERRRACTGRARKWTAGCSRS